MRAPQRAGLRSKRPKSRALTLKKGPRESTQKGTRTDAPQGLRALLASTRIWGLKIKSGVVKQVTRQVGGLVDRLTQIGKKRVELVAKSHGSMTAWSNMNVMRVAKEVTRMKIGLTGQEIGREIELEGTEKGLETGKETNQAISCQTKEKITILARFLCM